MVSKTETKYSKIFNRLTSLPTLPEVANKLLQLSEEDANPSKMAKIIETDAGITAKVLKLANSAFYALKNSVSNLSYACGLIGGRTIKSLVLSVSAMQVFKRQCKGFDQVRFWKNSVTTAMLARKIGIKVNLGDPDTIEEGYISGLLHAGGIPLFVQFYPDDYANVLEKWNDGEDSLLRLEEEEFGASHPEAGGEIIKHWRFPERIVSVIRYHRRTGEKLPDGLDENLVRMIDVVRLADFWTRRSGITFCDTDKIDSSEPAPIPDWMGIDEAGLKEEIGDVGSMLEGLESIFNNS